MKKVLLVLLILLLAALFLGGCNKDCDIIVMDKTELLDEKGNPYHATFTFSDGSGLKTREHNKYQIGDCK